VTPSSSSRTAGGRSGSTAATASLGPAPLPSSAATASRGSRSPSAARPPAAARAANEKHPATSGTPGTWPSLRAPHRHKHRPRRRRLRLRALPRGGRALAATPTDRASGMPGASG
jgi:hypothetical protein